MRLGSARSAVDVLRPQHAGNRHVHRVQCAADGRTIWFESDDLPLEPALEAFGSALLVPALHSGRVLRMEGPCCTQWAANMQVLTEEFRRLWYRRHPRPCIVPERLESREQRRGSGTMLCFSGGVDAFHTLLRGGHSSDTLVYVVGYDVKLRERGRAKAVVSLVRDVAHEMGCASCVICTNLRRHRLVRSTPWLHSFGGALAAVAHLLSAHGDRLLLSSDGLGFEHPEVGSRASTDHLFGSARVAVDHVSPSVTRIEKIRAIAGERIVQRHLRVCWRNVGALANCGRCEKCVRTMLALDACGMLGRYEGFACGRGLKEAIDSLERVDGVVDSFYRILLDQGLSSGVDTAVRRLLERSAQPPGRIAPTRRTSAMRRWTASLVRLALPAAMQRPGSRRPRARHRLLAPEAFAAVMAPLQGRMVGYVRPQGNVGDRLIELAMVQLFAEYGIRWRLWRPDADSESDGLDLLAFGGGGNMGARYAGNYELRTHALASGLPVVVLPQSFTSTEDRPYSCVFVRERTSLALRTDGTLAPDLALGLATVAMRPPRRDLGVFLRRDQERIGGKSLLPRDPVRWYRDPLEYLALAGRYRRIVTDRLHLAIAGMHAGRQVTLVANDYHKNKSMHETWLADMGCAFAESVADALARHR